MHEVIMPKLGLTMESGVIEKWHKSEGDIIKEGDILFEVMTDKVSLEVESFNSGRLLKILKEKGEEVPVTEIVAYIGKENEKIPENTLELSEVIIKSSSKFEDDKQYRKITKPSIDQKEEERINISPVAKKIALESNIDIKEMKGSGPRGRIIKKDVLDLIDLQGGKAGSNKNEFQEIKIKSSTTISGMRKTIADRMSLSKATIPHLVQFAEAEVTSLIELRKELKDTLLKKYDIKITFTDFIIMACSVALSENIIINSSLNGKEHIIYDDINIGLAVSVDNGLIVPTIFNVDKLGLKDIAITRNALVKKAREGNLGLNEIKNGTFTITNLGMYGIRSSIAIINPPQAAILAVGEIFDKPAVKDGNIATRSYMNISISCDHRLIDGAAAAKFLNQIVELLENPLLIISRGLF